MKRPHVRTFDDEEPNVEQQIEDDVVSCYEWETTWTSGLCERCGGQHRSEKCTNVQLWMLKNINDC